MTVDDILEKTETLIVTKGELGSVVMCKENNKIRSVEIPVAKVSQVSDPTGAGDAYRAGLIKGLATSKNDIVHAAKIGAVCAAYCVEVYGPQNFHFTHETFNKRFETVFGKRLLKKRQTTDIKGDREGRKMVNRVGLCNLRAGSLVLD